MNLGSSLIEDVPVPEGGAQRAMASGTRAVRRRRTGLLAGSAALAVVLLVGALVSRNNGDVSLSVAGSVPASVRAGQSQGAALLKLPAAALTATPPIPAGWQTVDYGLAQIAVPADWRVLLSSTAAGCNAVGGTVVWLGGFAMLNPGPLVGSCPQQGFVQMSATTESCSLCRVSTVNGLPVQFPDNPKCLGRGCEPTRFIPDLQLQLNLSVAPDVAAQILDTLTPSPQARALSDGPVSDSTNWVIVADQGAGIRVPPTWPTKRLEPTDEPPGSCGSNPFANSSDLVKVGQWPGIVDCKVQVQPKFPKPTDGAWIRTVAGPPSGPGGADQELLTAADSVIRVGRPDAPDFIELAVATRSGLAVISVGLGPDLSIARAIIRTITVDGQPL